MAAVARFACRDGGKNEIRAEAPRQPTQPPRAQTWSQYRARARRAIEPRAPEFRVGTLHRRKPAIDTCYVRISLGFGQSCVNRRAVHLALEIVPEAALLIHIGHGGTSVRG